MHREPYYDKDLPADHKVTLAIDPSDMGFVKEYADSNRLSLRDALGKLLPTIAAAQNLGMSLPGYTDHHPIIDAKKQTRPRWSN
jgi:hypothetical protein